MNKRFKKQLGKALSVILSVAMLVGALPAELLGGIASVKAAESAAAAYFDQTQGDWEDQGDGTATRTTTWDFTTLQPDSNAKLAVGDVAKGILGVAGTVQVKTAGAGLSMGGNSAIGILLDADTTSVAVSFTLTSNNGNRLILIGGDTASQKVYHSASNANKTDADGVIDSNKSFASEPYDADYMSEDDSEGKYLKLTAQTTGEGDSGENKLGKLTITETKSTTSGGEDPEMVAYKRVYDLRDGSIISADTSLNGTETLTSDDGLFKLEAGASNGYGYNGSQHGSILKSGNVITLSAGENSTITQVALGGCQYSNDTVTLAVTADGEEVKTFTGTKTTACYADEDTITDGENGLVVDYDGEATSLVLTFGGENVTYVPVVIVSGMEPKPEVTDVIVEVSIEDTDNLLGESGQILLNDGETDTDVTAGGAFQLKANTTYTVKTSDDSLKATVGGKTSFKTGTETMAVTIAIENTTVTLLPVFSGAELGNNKVYAKSSSNVYELKNNEEIILPKSTKLSLEVVDAEGNTQELWLAKVAGATSFTTPEKTLSGAEELAVEIIEVSSVQITPTIEGLGLLGDETITFVNEADGTDTVVVENGKAMELKPNATYKITLSASGIVATVNAKDTYTTGIENAEITIAVSTPVTKETTWIFNDRAATQGGIAVAGGKYTGTVGEILEGTDIEGSIGILYADKGTSSGAGYDGSQLRFRTGVILYLPVQDDTTKITYIQGSNSQKTDRLTYIGDENSGYSVIMPGGTSMVTINDVSDLIVTYNGQKYLPIKSSGDVKLDSITLVEYNPVNAVTVSGTITGAAEAGVKEITFKNMDNESVALVTAAVDGDGKYTAVLKRVNGMTNYAASIAALGYKIDDAEDADKFTLTGNGTTAVADFTVAIAPTKTITGKIIGVDDATVRGEFGAKLVPDNKALSSTVLELTRSGKGVYEFEAVTVDLGREYSVELVNADDLIVEKTLKFSAEDEDTVTIEAVKKPVYKVSGSFVTSDGGASDVTSITFTNMRYLNYSYTFEVTDGEYTAELRAGSYLTSVVSDKYTAYDHVDVADAAVTNDVYLQGEVDTSAVEYQEVVEVGEGKQFTKIADAVDYISRMTRTSDQRVTIELEKDKVYREQLVIDTPNITIKGNGATITWYYGVGFEYYSAKKVGNSAYYDEAYAVDKYYKQQISQNPGHWGATVNLLSGATGFAAENLTFENSLNRYLTEEELADGADANADKGVLPRTTANLDVRTKAAKERACVLYIQADNTEYKDCNLLSRQDTLYTGDGTESSYFKNCFIEGNVDYICGDGDAVFDECTLSMYGYSDAASTAGYIVANKAKAANGYLFNNCKIKYATDNGLKKTTANILARAWDKGTVYWLNTEVEDASIIAAAAYANMNAYAWEANYNEYNTHTPDGTNLDSQRELTMKDSAGEAQTVVKILTEEEAEAVDMDTFFGDWAPSYYETDAKKEISAMDITIAVPEAMNVPAVTAKTTQPGVALGNITWYAGEEVFTGETFGGETVYTASLTANVDSKYIFANSMDVTVNGESAATVEVSEDCETVEIKVDFPATGPEGYYNLDLTNGLKKGVKYDGGITVLEDMAAKETSAVELDGSTYTIQVQGSSNASPNKGAVPKSGAVLVVDAVRNGNIIVAIKSTGGKAIHFVSESGKDYFTTDEKPSANSVYKLPVEKGETYYLYGDGTKIVYYSIIADYRTIVRPSWEEVADPEIVDVFVGAPYETEGVTANAAAGEIKVSVKGYVNDVKGADSVNVKMLDEQGNVVASKSSSKANDDAEYMTEFSFNPSASGKYSFVARLVRDGEADKVGKESQVVDFVLPMGHAQIASVANKFKGNAEEEGATGALEIAWNAVTEAEYYVLTVTDANNEVLKSSETDDTIATVENLPLGAAVTIAVEAVGADDKNVSVPSEKTGDQVTVTVEAKNERTWAFTAYGSSIALSSNKYTKNEDGSITLESTGGKGKIVPGSTDGLAFYYTAVDPATENFTLTADVHVDKWTLSNGQEGLGLMVADTIGKNGDGTAFWNNSYQLLATKIEYNWDPNANDGQGAVTNATAGENGVLKYSMKLGLGWVAKEGTTLTDVAKITAGEQATPTNFSSTSGTLETSAAVANKSAGTYNIVGNATAAVDGTISELTDFKLQIQRSNAGYVLRYLDSDGAVIGEKTFYDDDANKLTQIDKRNIYVGFIASRNAKITVSNIDFVTINPADDEPAGTKEITYVDPNYQILSSDTSNTEEYDLVYYGNVDGKLTIVDDEGNALTSDLTINAKKKYEFRTHLTQGDNKFEITVVPDKNFIPGDNQLMSNYDKKSFSFHVNYRDLGEEVIYVSPTGKSSNLGTEASPVDIYTAVNYAKAGDKIYLLGGTYKLSTPIVIDRGHDGTADAPIYLMADPTDSARPVLNFSRQTENATAMTLAGNYWYLKGFDVTESKDAQKGLQVSGKYNVVEDVDAYKNGNTGIQISRYLGTDGYDMWPAYNTILNCTSYLNADAGYEDADGFAAKLTVADGNKFVGCIAAYNADDGWDLFAKVQSGSIGAVTIDNCVAFKNGYIVDDNGAEVDAGNGNGFKMGGDSMSGYHVLKNSVAFGNKAKGIDSNSCPDIQVYNCTSFNNESYNVAMYTNTAVKTDYYATGILSIKNSNKVAEQIKPVGTQNLSKIYNDTNYYFDGKKSVNASGAQASLDWFKSVDMDAAISGAKAITRDADGTINMHGFLELNSKAPEGVGARMSSTAVDVVIEETPVVKVFANGVKKLSDVKLPEALTEAGYSWKYPETATAVFSGTESEFLVSAEGKDDKPVLVDFIEITGVDGSFEADVLYKKGAGVLAYPELLTSPTGVSLEDVQGEAVVEIAVTSSSKTLHLTLNEDGTTTLLAADDTATGAHKVSFTLNAVVNGQKIKKTCVKQIIVKGIYEYAPDFRNAEGSSVDDTDNELWIEKGETITLGNLLVKNVADDSTSPVQVAVGDKKILSYDAKTASFTALTDGTTTITFTTKADKTFVEKYVVTVIGNALKTNVSSITVDKAKSDGAQLIALNNPWLIQAGSVTIKSVTKGKEDVTRYFTIENVAGNLYKIATIDTVSKLSNGNYTMILSGMAGIENEGYEAKDFEPVTVNVTETKPSVTIKQSEKVNLFYTAGSVNSNGALTVSSKQAKVTLTQVNADNCAYRIRASKTGYDIILKSDKTDLAKKQNKLEVKVSYSGYKSVYDKIVTIKVATENVAPKLVVEADNSVFNTNLGINQTELRFLDRNTNVYVTGADVKLVENALSNQNFKLTDVNGVYTLSTTKSGTAKISVQDADWTREIVLNKKITVTAAVPKATFVAVTLNTMPEVAGLEVASSKVTIKDIKDYTVRDISLKGKNAAADELMQYLNYEMTVDDEGVNLLNVSLNQELPVTANGTCKFRGAYTYDVTFTLNKMTNMKATVKLTLAPTATVTTKQSGSIDLINRTGSAVNVTPTLKNLNGRIIGVVLDDDASNQFEAVWDSAKNAAVVTAKEGIDMKRGGKYKITPTFIVETNGGDVEVAAKTIVISPRQSATIKVTNLVNALEVKLSDSTPAKATFKAVSPANANILELEQTNYQNQFSVIYDELSDTITVSILDRADLKAGSTYKINVRMYVEGAGVNTKPQVVTVPVKVSK